MPAELNHTIVHAEDPVASATFLTEVLGLDPPVPFGPFQVVVTGNGASLDFIDAGGEPFDSQHYSFLVTDDEYPVVRDRVLARGLDTWGDPGRTEPGGEYRHNGGTGFYFCGPSGHFLEIQTRPYL
ncbi:MAG: glyoxalase/bleomycin resistance protein/dioxygenase [Ilumatobacteraceae bacterium]|nr:glyoxalase/bleomycin resistance protein/dioxygenase [Ilumatobacteraceae bacterium]